VLQLGEHEVAHGQGHRGRREDGRDDQPAPEVQDVAEPQRPLGASLLRALAVVRGDRQRAVAGALDGAHERGDLGGGSEPHGRTVGREIHVRTRHA
jgi:hypothetical protein